MKSATFSPVFSHYLHVGFDGNVDRQAAALMKGEDPLEQNEDPVYDEVDLFHADKDTVNLDVEDDSDQMDDDGEEVMGMELDSGLKLKKNACNF